MRFSLPWCSPAVFWLRWGTFWHLGFWTWWTRRRRWRQKRSPISGSSLSSARGSSSSSCSEGRFAPPEIPRPLYLGLGLTVLNLVASVVLIRGIGPIPSLGTAGAAIGTAMSGLVMSAVASG